MKHLERTPPRPFYRLGLRSIGRLRNNVFYLYVYLSEQAIELSRSGKLVAIVSFCAAICFLSKPSLCDLLLRPACYLSSCLSFFGILITHCAVRSSFAALTHSFLQALIVGLSYLRGRSNLAGTTKVISTNLQQTCRQTSLGQEAVHSVFQQCFFNNTDLPSIPLNSINEA